MVDCPDCGAEAEWVEITGDCARPTGSVYHCPDCNREFARSTVVQ